ncbi:hypothetical protein R6Q59_018920 [Mikania micrantha]
MSKKRKRGTSKCKKKFLNPDQFRIEFDKNGLAKGENKSFFMSWVGLEFRKQIPYHKVVKDIDPKLYDDIWEYTKETWNISNDQAKAVTLKKGKASMRNFRHDLVEYYQHWDYFVANVSKQEFKSIIGCELTWPFDDSCPDLVLARGRVYPTSQRILHGRPISDGFVKVQVDFVNENCTRFPILPQTRTDEVNEMADTQGQFIQWPRKSIKVYLIYIMNAYLSIYCYIKILIFFYNIQLLNTESLQESIALNQQAPQHSGEYRPLMLNGELLIQSAHTEDVIDNQTSGIKDVPHPQTTHTEDVSDPQTNHAKNIPAPKPTEILPDPKKIAPILTLAKSRPQKIYRLAEKLAHVYAQTNTINFTSPHGMYMVDYHENVDVESMMQLCVNGWVDYAFAGFKGFHKTTYFNPRVVELGVCNTDPNFVINYIKAVMEHHKDKQYFMAPYLSGSHWSLIMIHRNPKDNKFYGSIIDSINKGKDAQCYPIVDIFKKAIGKSISWHMVNCYQQSETWECGYYIMKAMYDFVICCKEHLMMHNNRPLLKDEIDEFIEHTLENFMIIFGQ